MSWAISMLRPAISAGCIVFAVAAALEIVHLLNVFFS
jgi:hypothetical protein